MNHRNTARNAWICAMAAAACLMSLAVPASATTNRRVATERFTEFATVIDVKPVFRDVRIREPRQECWTESQEYIVGYEDSSRYERYQAGQQANHSAGQTIIGGLIGGVIGNQLGRGHSRGSRTGATVAGAIIGGALANESQGRTSRHRRHERTHGYSESRPIYETREVERCKRTVESRSEQQLQHYNVTYRYKGRTFTTQLPRDPGNRIELQVSVSPARR